MPRAPHRACRPLWLLTVSPGRSDRRPITPRWQCPGPAARESILVAARSRPLFARPGSSISAALRLSPAPRETPDSGVASRRSTQDGTQQQHGQATTNRQSWRLCRFGRRVSPAPRRPLHEKPRGTPSRSAGLACRSRSRGRPASKARCAQRRQMKRASAHVAGIVIAEPREGHREKPSVWRGMGADDGRGLRVRGRRGGRRLAGGGARPQRSDGRRPGCAAGVRLRAAGARGPQRSLLDRGVREAPAEDVA